MKKIIAFIFILLPWFLSLTVMNIDKSYYSSLKLPSFEPPTIIFDIIQIIIYALISYNVLKIYNEYKFDECAKNYYSILALNYIFNQLLIPIYFCLYSLFLGFVDTIAMLISSLWLYYECRKLNNVTCKLLIPNIIWSLIATLLAISIYFINL